MAGARRLLPAPLLLENSGDFSLLHRAVCGGGRRFRVWRQLQRRPGQMQDSEFGHRDPGGVNAVATVLAVAPQTLLRPQGSSARSLPLHTPKPEAHGCRRPGRRRAVGSRRETAGISEYQVIGGLGLGGLEDLDCARAVASRGLFMSASVADVLARLGGVSMGRRIIFVPGGVTLSPLTEIGRRKITPTILKCGSDSSAEPASRVAIRASLDRIKAAIDTRDKFQRQGGKIGLRDICLSLVGRPTQEVDNLFATRFGRLIGTDGINHACNRIGILPGLSMRLNVRSSGISGRMA